MKRIAVVFEGGLDNLTGLTNAVLSRVQYLTKVSDYKIDVYDILSYPFGLSRLRFPKSKYHKRKTVLINGVKINVLWYKNILLDSIINFKLHKPPFFLDYCLHRWSADFKDYDLISAHAFVGAKMAFQINRRFGTPFCVTWHGSEIHSVSHTVGAYQFEMTRKIMSRASCNFFVSRALQESACVFSDKIISQILYNGVDERFYKYSDEKRKQIREKYWVTGKKVVAFVGNLKPVKNAALLPDIFNNVSQKYNRDIVFWIIGEGEERKSIIQKLSDMSIKVKMWGYQTVEIMPELLQCVDVLVLPSQNEGLGMVLLEAIACGANAVGSDAGGIGEVVGKENAISLESGFLHAISDRIVYFLEHEEPQEYPTCCSWATTAKKENDIYNHILTKKL